MSCSRSPRVLFILSLICYSSAGFKVFPLGDEVVALPSNGVLHSAVSLTCAIEPPDYIHSPFWITPMEDVVDTTNANPHYELINGAFLNNHRTVTTVLQIKNLSYIDAGNYSCVVYSVDAANTERTQQAQASIELRLSVQLTTTSQNATINSTTSHVNFSCEMSDYILPDEKLQWTDSSSGVLENSEKYTITYENGKLSAAQNGGNIRLPSRISTLTIHSPTAADTGKFICIIQGSNQFIAMDLKVEPAIIKPRDVENSNITYTVLSASTVINCTYYVYICILLCVLLVIY